MGRKEKNYHNYVAMARGMEQGTAYKFEVEHPGGLIRKLYESLPGDEYSLAQDRDSVTITKKPIPITIKYDDLSPTTDSISKMTDKDYYIGIDLDGTLARYDGYQGIQHIGEPVKPMLEMVRSILKDGSTVVNAWGTHKVKKVKVFTARCGQPAAYSYVRLWLDELGLEEVGITDRKEPGCLEWWDDRAVQVELNTGMEICDTCNIKEESERYWR